MARTSTYLLTNSGLRVDHELLRNAIISGAAGCGDDGHWGVDCKDKRFGAASPPAVLTQIAAMLECDAIFDHEG